MNALKMIMIPIIVSSIVFAMFNISPQGEGVGRVGLKVFTYYICTSLIAIIVGLAIVNLIQPGHLDEPTAEAILRHQAGSETFMPQLEGRSSSDLIDIILRMVPPNIFKVTADNRMLLSVIVVSLVFGFFMNRLPKNLRDVHMKFWDGLQKTMIMVTQLILKFAPFGVFGWVTPTPFRTGLDILGLLIWFFVTVLLALGFHFFIILRFVGGINPILHYKAMTQALVTAFSTVSSLATLPVTLEYVKKKAGISNRISSFTLPLGVWTERCYTSV